MNELVGSLDRDRVKSEKPFCGAFHVVLGHTAVGAQHVPDAVVDAAFNGDAVRELP
jgi:hypothetical protein